LARSGFLLGLTGVFLFCLVVSPVFATSGKQAQVAIDRAEARMSTAYESVLEAERAGANVSSLLLRLNNGSALLAKAKMQYQIGNFSEAADFANQSLDSLNGIEIEANRLRDGAVIERKQRKLIAGVESAFAIGAVLYAGIFGWRFFRDKYYKRVLKMKPEVQVNDPR